MSASRMIAGGRSMWRHHRRLARFAPVAQHLGLGPGWRVVPTEGDTAVAIGPDRIVKAALSTAAAAGLLHHRQMVERLHQIGIGDIAPHVLEHGRVGGSDYLVETRCDGRPLPRSTAPETLDAAARTVAALHEATATRVRMDADTFTRIVGRKLESVAGDPRVDAPRSAVQALHQALHQAFDRPWIALSTVHGDHWHANVIGDLDAQDSRVAEPTAESRRVSKARLVDWENGAILGLPELDHVHYLLALHPDGASAARHGLADAPATIGEWLGARVDWLAGETMNPDLPAVAVIVATWVHHVAGGLGRASRYGTSARWVRAHAAPLFDPDVVAAVSRAVEPSGDTHRRAGSRR